MPISFGSDYRYLNETEYQSGSHCGFIGSVVEVDDGADLASVLPEVIRIEEDQIEGNITEADWGEYLTHYIYGPGNGKSPEGRRVSFWLTGKDYYLNSDLVLANTLFEIRICGKSENEYARINFNSAPTVFNDMCRLIEPHSISAMTTGLKFRAIDLMFLYAQCSTGLLHMLNRSICPRNNGCDTTFAFTLENSAITVDKLRNDDSIAIHLNEGYQNYLEEVEVTHRAGQGAALAFQNCNTKLIDMSFRVEGGGTGLARSGTDVLFQVLRVSATGVEKNGMKPVWIDDRELDNYATIDSACVDGRWEEGIRLQPYVEQWFANEYCSATAPPPQLRWNSEELDVPFNASRVTAYYCCSPYNYLTCTSQLVYTTNSPCNFNYYQRPTEPAEGSADSGSGNAEPELPVCQVTLPCDRVVPETSSMIAASSIEVMDMSSAEFMLSSISEKESTHIPIPSSSVSAPGTAIPTFIVLPSESLTERETSSSMGFTTIYVSVTPSLTGNEGGENALIYKIMIPVAVAATAVMTLAIAIPTMIVVMKYYLANKVGVKP